jgi:hypothetical protein
MRASPSPFLSENSTNQTSEMQDIVSTIINLYQSGELQTIWSDSPLTGYTGISSFHVQEPLNQTTVSLSVIAGIELVVPPSLCRAQSPCSIQPVLVAYDSNGDIIQKLGSDTQPWLMVASVVGQPTVNLLGAIANYSCGQTQYTTFGLPNTGSYQIQFTFIQPNGVNR